MNARGFLQGLFREKDHVERGDTVEGPGKAIQPRDVSEGRYPRFGSGLSVRDGKTHGVRNDSNPCNGGRWHVR